MPASRQRDPAVQISDPALRLFALAAGLSVANVYYAQPLLDSMARSLHLDEASSGAIITVTQAGYAAGLLFIVPLGDVLNRRRLLASLLSLSAIALAVVSFAMTKEMLLTGLFFVGLLAVVVQVLVAAAASLVSPEKRGRAVGAVTSGVVLGILLARTVAGALSDLGGWKLVYLASSLSMLLLAYALQRTLPNILADTGSSYLQLLASTVTLYRDSRMLRMRAAIAFFLFAAFSTLWTSMVFPLSAPPHSLSHTFIGLIGLAGVAGAMAAGSAGRWADQGHGQSTTGIALGLLLLSWACIACLRSSFSVFLVGVVTLDFAVQSVHVTSQSLIFAELPAAKSRLVAAYMLLYSIGSGTGAWTSTHAYALFQWRGVSILGAGFSLMALGIWAFSQIPFDGAQPS
jgi:predicted MFS family arabinose efflux permease